MCNSPVSIKNPNYGLKHLKGIKDISHEMIRVPCGHCSECIARRQMDYVQRVQIEAMNNHLFFTTLTYQNSMLPVVSTSSGYDIRFADVSDVQKMIKRIRINNSFGRNFRYFAVSELGSKRGRPHFHILWCLPIFKDDTFYDIMNLEKTLFDVILSEWKRNYGTDKFPKWESLCKYVKIYTRNGPKFNYETKYLNPALTKNGVSDVAFYVLKYMLKPSYRAIRLQQALHLNLPEDEYEHVWSLVRPRVFKSLYFGDDIYDKDSRSFSGFDVETYIRHCIALSKSKDFPCFVNPANGDFYPLSRYYKSRFLLLDDLKNWPIENRPEYEDDHISQIVTKIKKYEKIENFEDSRDLFDDFPDF